MIIFSIININISVTKTVNIVGSEMSEIISMVNNFHPPHAKKIFSPEKSH